MKFDIKVGSVLFVKLVICLLNKWFCCLGFRLIFMVCVLFFVVIVMKLVVGYIWFDVLMVINIFVCVRVCIMLFIYKGILLNYIILGCSVLVGI